MGFLDALLGGRRKLSAPARDRLFAMSTAHVAFEAELGLKHRDRAGIVFQALPTGDFQAMVAETEELLRGATEETGTLLETADDEFGYRWMVLSDPDFEDLVVSLNTVSSQLQASGYGDRLLCAVFAFEESGRPLYFIYNFKRGAYYPFAPTGTNARDNERELRLKAQAARELPMEQELERWFPLWEIPL